MLTISRILLNEKNKRKIGEKFRYKKKNLFKSPKIININKDKKKKKKEKKTKPIANLG